MKNEKEANNRLKKREKGELSCPLTAPNLYTHDPTCVLFF